MLNLRGDISDLATVFGDSDAHHAGHCSALLRLLPDLSDVYISQVGVCMHVPALMHQQVTWSSLNSMLRIFKLYDFPYTLDGTSRQQVPAVRSSFSSYPGSLFSGDDFYVLSSGMVVQETTIGAACMNTS